MSECGIEIWGTSPRLVQPSPAHRLLSATGLIALTCADNTVERSTASRAPTGAARRTVVHEKDSVGGFGLLASAYALSGSVDSLRVSPPYTRTQLTASGPSVEHSVLCTYTSRYPPQARGLCIHLRFTVQVRSTHERLHIQNSRLVAADPSLLLCFRLRPHPTPPALSSAARLQTPPGIRHPYHPTPSHHPDQFTAIIPLPHARPDLTNSS